MAYQKEKDILVKVWAFEGEGESDTLEVGIYQYNGGDKKLQIGPRTFERKNGDMGHRKAGRLTVAETAWLATVLVEAAPFMTD